MAWTKQSTTTHTARVGNDDLAIRFFFAADAAGARVPHVELTVQSEAPDGSVTTEALAVPLSTAGYTAQERTALIALLAKGRDLLLPQMLFVET